MKPLQSTHNLSQLQRVFPTPFREHITPMARVPAGFFVMGTSEVEKKALRLNAGLSCPEWESEGPAHLVYLDEFEIDTYPVTNSQYAAFVQQTGHQTRGWWRPTYPPDRELHPVVSVDWFDAQAFANFCGKRLPTEAEWEKAARGEDGRMWPWGDFMDEGLCNAVDHCELTLPVGSFPRGASPYGVQDMAGNVWEWCADNYRDEYDVSACEKFADVRILGQTAAIHAERRNPKGPATGTQKVIRGGSFEDGIEWVRCATRAATNPENSDRNLGFRCAR